MSRRTSRSSKMMEKSVEAALSAIEVYNKPTFEYRDETFAILLINAWELLLKAYLLKINDNKMTAIYDMQYRKNQDGSQSKRKYPKKNRSGNNMTIGLRKAVNLLRDKTTLLPDEVAENLALLEEVRDNAIHHMNAHLGLSARVQEIGTASLRNFMVLAQEWFDYDLSKYNFFLLPMSFHHQADIVESFSVSPPNKQMKNMLSYLSRVEHQFPSDEGKEYNITLRVDTRFVRSKTDAALKVQFSDDPNAPKVTITEEEALQKYPLDYHDLLDKLKKRYSDFVQNNNFYAIKKEIVENDKLNKLSHTRLLDPKNPKSGKKTFYSSNILKEFDEYYTKNKK